MIGPGSKVKLIRLMTKAEMEAERWDRCADIPTVIEFEDGMVIYASRDEEGNGPGALFGVDGEGSFMLWAEKMGG